MAPRTTQTSRRRPRTFDPKKVLLLKQALIGCGLALLVGGLLTGVWFGTRLETFTISEVSVIGGDTIDHERVRQIVESVLADSYFHLIPKQFVYLYPEQLIIKTVLTDIDRLKEVSLERIGRTGLSVHITEQIPIALWCSADGEDCLFLNSSGVAFASAPILTGGSLLRIYDTTNEPKLHTTVYDNDRFQDLLALVEALEIEVGWGTNVVVREADDRVVIQMVNEAELFVRLEQPVSHTLHYLTSLLGTEEYEHLFEQSFAYIDLRFGNRVFVNQTLVAGVATSTAETVDTALGTALDLSQPTIVGGSGPSVDASATDTAPAREADVTQTSVVETTVGDDVDSAAD